jgi:hypothetical protein
MQAIAEYTNFIIKLASDSLRVLVHFVFVAKTKYLRLDKL